MSSEELAKNPNTAPETLRELAQNEDIDIRMTVAANPGIPLDLAQSFIDVGDEWIRMNVARYTPHLEILKKLVVDKSDMVREAVAKNSNAPLDLFDIDRDSLTQELGGYTDNLHKEILILNIKKDDLINENYNDVEEIGRFESGDWETFAALLSEEEAEKEKKESEEYKKEVEEGDDGEGEYEYFINTTYLYCENKYVHSVSSFTKEDSY